MDTLLDLDGERFVIDPAGQYRANFHVKTGTTDAAQLTRSQILHEAAWTGWRVAGLAELAELSGCAKSNLSRTLGTLESYNLVILRKGPNGRIAPRVAYSDIVLDVPIDKRGETP